MGFYGSRGYITLSDIDSMATDISTLKDSVKAIDTQVSGSSDLMYYGAGTATAVPLSLTQTAIEACRYPYNLISNSTITHTFTAPFLEAPVVIATTDTNTAVYVCTVTSVTNKQALIKVKYVSGTATSSGEGINVIAVGKTAS